MKSKLLAAAVLLSACALAAEIPLPEHPRPDWERAEWMNLNGTWQFEFDFGDSGKWKELWKDGHGTFDKEILVPFVPESKL